ncbi:MAG: hypothetical protein KBG73_16380, partial [Candidatus Promineofilum sp.]|nr:hypothetical protein [Promineifilum sp.]
HRYRVISQEAEGRSLASTATAPTPASVTVQALRTGQFTLPITYHKIVLRTGMKIPSTAQDCAITFVDADSGGVTFVPFTAAD